MLRHLYGSFVSVSSDDDNTSITVNRVFPVEPPVNPETSIASSQNLTILADATNGTLFYDMDAKTHSTIMNFSSVASDLTGKFRSRRGALSIERHSGGRSHFGASQLLQYRLAQSGRARAARNDLEPGPGQ